ncbi:hypothetical protein V4D30_09555 [Thermodesulfovibrio sp. 3907-1M]|uniref:DUF4239 domain-containing protein n=1 Tax=Thermodesulfovibrio autotrophicus TaxID=3118333 RepID=A0AAU8GYA9_9BACT
MKRISLFFLILILIMLLIFYLRLFLQQKDFMNKAKHSNDSIKAITYYERVILSYIPFSPYSREAVNGILEKCKKTGDDEQKLYCYETLRSALYQVRSFYQPYREEIKKLEPLIAELKTYEMIQWKYNNLSEKDYQRLYNYNIEIMQYDSSPSVFWSMVSVLSLFAWICSVCFIILKGLKTPINKRYLLWGLTGFILFFSLWIIGLYNA